VCCVKGRVGNNLPLRHSTALKTDACSVRKTIF
jgi:hypothetical protein